MKDGFLIKAFREDKGISRRQLAEASGIPERTLEKYEQGKIKLEDASYKTVIKLSKALGVAPTDLVI